MFSVLVFKLKLLNYVQLTNHIGFLKGKFTKRIRFLRNGFSSVSLTRKNGMQPKYISQKRIPISY
jgi:hypothetical protein